MEVSKQPVARLRYGAEEYLLYPGQPLSLGRADENAVVIHDPQISRFHAEIEWNGSGCMLRDLGSVNGTFVNGRRLGDTAYLLRDGDEIVIHKDKLLYEIIRVDPPAPLQEPAATALPGTRAPNGGAYLVVSAGPDLGQEYPLWGEIITIGRSCREATWEIRLSDRAVSRPHARLERGKDEVLLVDLESANGTLLNGSPVQLAAPLKDGDVISVGETRLVYRDR